MKKIMKKEQELTYWHNTLNLWIVKRKKKKRKKHLKILTKI